MRRLWIMAAYIWGLSASVQAAEPIRYTLTPVLKDGALTALEVSIRFHADSSGTTRINLPNHWGGGQKFYTYLTDIEVDNAKSVTAPEPETRLVASAPNATLNLHYRLNVTLKADEEAPADTDFRYPLIAPNRFYVLGPEIFAMIDGRHKSSVAFSWTEAEGWIFASDLEHLPPSATDADIRQSVLLGGKDVHIEQVSTPHTDLRIATAGIFDFSLPRFNVDIAKIITTEQAFWGDGQNHFLVTLTPMTRQVGLQGVLGTGLSDAFAMITTPDVSEIQLSTTLAHEYFHSWNIEKLGGQENEDTPASGYWFSEGFTDYYGRKMALKAGIIDLTQFVEAWNSKLNQNGHSTVRKAPNSRITADFWNDEDVQNLAYERGALFAAWLNAKWRPQGVTLDHFMIVLRDEIKANPKLGEQPLAMRLQAVADKLGVPLADDLKLYIEQGEDIPLPENVFGGCISVKREQAAVFSLGYDSDASRAAGVFTGVDPNSNAYKAGLRNGMKRLEVTGGDPDDSRVPLNFRVGLSDGTEKIITWLPQGNEHFERLRLVIPEGLDNTALAACASAVAGG